MENCLAYITDFETIEFPAGEEINDVTEHGAYILITTNYARYRFDGELTRTEWLN